jgi:hypothetical protein
LVKLLLINYGYNVLPEDDQEHLLEFIEFLAFLTSFSSELVFIPDKKLLALAIIDVALKYLKRIILNRLD